MRAADRVVEDDRGWQGSPAKGRQSEMENGSAAARPLRRRRRARGLIAPALAVVALLVAACGGGGGGGGGGSSSSSGPTTLKVGVIPIADVAPLYIGIKQGFFKQEKL